MLRDRLTKAWYQKKLTFLTGFLYPFSFLFLGIVLLRRFFYERGWLASTVLPVPVIVVGNVTVGGTGKTPTVIALADYLKSQGYHVGIICRGVGGGPSLVPRVIHADANPAVVGDEAVLLAKRAGVPVAVSTDRVAAAKKLIKDTGCNVIISDDGLQHYRLKPTYTLALVDVKRQYGNQCLLPAGPLREPLSRLQDFDSVLTTGRGAGDICINPDAWHRLSDESTEPLSFFSGKPAHVIAGIAHPAGFFEITARLGVFGQLHSFPDHHRFTPQDLYFQPAQPVLMTEKDAVKCVSFAMPDQWYLSEAVVLPDALKQALNLKLTGGLS